MRKVQDIQQQQEYVGIWEGPVRIEGVGSRRRTESQTKEHHMEVRRSSKERVRERVDGNIQKDGADRRVE